MTRKRARRLLRLLLLLSHAWQRALDRRDIPSAQRMRQRFVVVAEALEVEKER